jgi:hypothetical protein
MIPHRRLPMLNYWFLSRLSSSNSFKTLGFPLFVVAVVFCTLGTSSAAQEQTSPGTSATQEQTSPPSNARTNDDEGKGQTAPEMTSSTRRHGDTSLQLGVGDLIEMNVYGVPELATKTRISSNGDMYCPLIGYT